LRNTFDAAITTLKDDGTLAAISEKWFGSDITVAE
jgi:putative amino-acid transport system substrate-binding protein